MQHKSTFNVKTMALIGVLSALVFALSLISFPIPLPFSDQTRIHFGNIMCLLAGALFGPLAGGLAAGFGSMVYDFTNPLYASEFWLTFLTKFAMGWVAGIMAQYPLGKLPLFPRALLAGLGGQAVYIALYLCKTAVLQYFIYGVPWAAVLVVVGGKAVVSGINGLIAVVGCSLLAPALRTGLDAAGLFRQKPGHPAG